MRRMTQHLLLLVPLHPLVPLQGHSIDSHKESEWAWGHKKCESVRGSATPRDAQGQGLGTMEGRPVKALDHSWGRRVAALLRVGDCLACFGWPSNLEGRAYVLVCLCCREQGFPWRGSALPAAGELHEQMFFRFPEQLYPAHDDVARPHVARGLLLFAAADLAEYETPWNLLEPRLPS
jgi:hypothetical protein